MDSAASSLCLSAFPIESAIVPHSQQLSAFTRKGLLEAFPGLCVCEFHP